jgi:hypothetical protein
LKSDNLSVQFTHELQSYCTDCEKQVTAITVLDRAELRQAFHTDADIEVMHVSKNGDHRWKLKTYEKENLRKRKSEGAIET